MEEIAIFLQKREGVKADAEEEYDYDIDFEVTNPELPDSDAFGHAILPIVSDPNLKGGNYYVRFGVHTNIRPEYVKNGPPIINYTTVQDKELLLGAIPNENIPPADTIPRDLGSIPTVTSIL